MADRLVVNEERGVYRIQWLVQVDGYADDDVGATVGDDSYLADRPEPKDRSDWECWVAARVARADKHCERDSNGYYWESERHAKAVLKQIQMAFKQDRPLPDWAKTALAEGWKPPKGWKA